MDDGGQLQGARPAYIRQALEASSRRLGTRDLDQLHRPDPNTPIEETLGALNELVREGLVRHVGLSKMDAAGVRAADGAARRSNLALFTSCQDEYSLLVRDMEGELIPSVRELGLGLLPSFPLASEKHRAGQPLPEGARITGSEGAQNRYLTGRNWRVVEDLRQFAEVRGHTLLDLAFSWLLSNDVTSSVIAGATRPEQIDQNVAAAAWTLTPQDLGEVDRLTPA